jgi:thiol:disulfide interchange protein
MSSSSLSNSHTAHSSSESAFGPPFAYYKSKRSSASPKLFIVSLIFVVFVIVDFLLATNIIIYVRSLDLDDNKEIFIHSLVVCLSVFAIWVTYKISVWITKKFKIKESLKKNKLYQKVANEVIELENLLGAEQEENKRS